MGFSMGFAMGFSMGFSMCRVDVCKKYVRNFGLRIMFMNNGYDKLLFTGVCCDFTDCVGELPSGYFYIWKPWK